MAKILTDYELADIITRAAEDQSVIDDSDAYEHFLEDLAELICDHFGGIRGCISGPDDHLGWTAGFHVDDRVPEDGGIFKDYDKDVLWKAGKEEQL